VELGEIVAVVVIVVGGVVAFLYKLYKNLDYIHLPILYFS
jgi:hypothetical protein